MRRSGSLEILEYSSLALPSLGALATPARRRPAQREPPPPPVRESASVIALAVASTSGITFA